MRLMTTDGIALTEKRELGFQRQLDYQWRADELAL